MSLAQATDGPIDVAAKFFRDLDDSNISDDSLRDWVNSLPPGYFTPFSDAGGELERKQFQWDLGYFNLQKLAAQHNFSKERIDHLLDIRRVARVENWVGMTANVPSAADTTDSLLRKASYTEEQPSMSFMPADDFRRRFENVPLAHAQEALKAELGDARNTTIELQALVDWCEKIRPDIFESYTVDDFAPTVSNPLSGDFQVADFYIQRGWLDRNFSKKRFIAIVTLRDLLRKQRKLPVAQRETPIRTAEGEKPDSTRKRTTDEERDALLLKNILDWIKTHLWRNIAVFVGFVLLIALVYRHCGN